MGYWRRLTGLGVLGMALLVGYGVDVRWAYVVLFGSLGAFLSSWIAAYTVGWQISALAAILGGAVASMIVEYLAFPLLDVHTPPHLFFVFIGCIIGLTTHVLLGPRRVNNQEERRQ